MAEDSEKLRNELLYLTALIRNHKNAQNTTTPSNYTSYPQSSYKYTKPKYERSKMSWTRPTTGHRIGNQNEYMRNVKAQNAKTDVMTSSVPRKYPGAPPPKNIKTTKATLLPVSKHSVIANVCEVFPQLDGNQVKSQVVSASVGTSQGRPKHNETDVTLAVAGNSATASMKNTLPSNTSTSTTYTGNNSIYKWTSKDSQVNAMLQPKPSTSTANVHKQGKDAVASTSGNALKEEKETTLTSRFKLKRTHSSSTLSSRTEDGNTSQSSHQANRTKSAKNRHLHGTELRTRYKYIRQGSKGNITSKSIKKSTEMSPIAGVTTRYKFIRKGSGKSVKMPKRSQLSLNRIPVLPLMRKSRYSLIRKGACATTPEAGWVSRYSLKKGYLMKEHQGVKKVRSSRYKLVKISKKRSSVPKVALPSRAKLKLDRRLNKVLDVNTGTQYVSIGGILYRSSAKKLAKASLPVKVSDNRAVIKKTRNKLIREAPDKKQSHHHQNVIVNIRGQRFTMDPSGKTLRIWRDVPSSSEKVTAPSQDKGLSRVDFGGMTFVQTTPGTLVRKTGYTKTLANRVLQRSIHTTNAMKWKKSKSKQFCLFYNRFGKCNRGDKCPYIHDPDKVAVCTRFLRGTCKDPSCPFSHKVSKNKMPVCSFFLRGVCNRDDCPYLHVKVNHSAAVCEDFLNGYCPLAEKCKKRHILECPEFAKSGVCAKGRKCKMVHKTRRGTKRKSSLPLDRKEVQEKKLNIESNTEVMESQMTTEEIPDVERHQLCTVSIATDEEECSKLPSFISLVDEQIQDTDKTHEKDKPLQESLHIRPRFLVRKTLAND